jgi:hypothetical protein
VQELKMIHKYHAYNQAKEYAEAVIPVPIDYPLLSGLDKCFRINFAELTHLIKKIYMDIAENSEQYGVMLLPIEETDINRITDSYRSIRRFVDVLSALFFVGHVDNHVLTVDIYKFKEQVKKITKYGLILNKLIDFGFTINEFDGSHIDKAAVFMFVEYPNNPHIINVIKTYCENWLKLNQNRPGSMKERRKNQTLMRLSPEAFGGHYYRFDYKITADLSKIPMSQWVIDEAEYRFNNEQQKQFYINFYKTSLAYKELEFDGEYFIKNKRMARVFPGSSTHVTIKLKNMDQYIGYIETLPNHIKTNFRNDNCNHCGFQGATNEYCKTRIYWTFDNIQHEGCTGNSFNFDKPEVGDLPFYFKLIELEYGIK